MTRCKCPLSLTSFVSTQCGENQCDQKKSSRTSTSSTTSATSSPSSAACAMAKISRRDANHGTTRTRICQLLRNFHPNCCQNQNKFLLLRVNPPPSPPPKKAYENVRKCKAMLTPAGVREAPGGSNGQPEASGADSGGLLVLRGRPALRHTGRWHTELCAPKRKCS